MLLNILQTYFQDFHILDIVDIILVGILFYQAYRIMRGNVSINIFFGIIFIIVMWRLVAYLGLTLTENILRRVVDVGIIAIIILFQPEIRRFLLMVGSRDFINRKAKNSAIWRYLFKSHSQAEPLNIDAIIQACSRMSKTMTGALIVIAKESELEPFAATGELIEAKISSQLLENIFYKNSPLHDGAVIIVSNRINAARCILPVSSNRDISPNLGLRHRSAIGITEITDAVAIIVSEQTGFITYCRNGELTRNVTPSELKIFLEEEFLQGGNPKEETSKK